MTKVRTWKQCHTMGSQLLDEFHLKSWTIRAQKTWTTTLAETDFVKKVIWIQQWYATRTPLPDLRDTLLHEIAHVLTGVSGHTRKWYRCAKRIGCKVNEPDDPPLVLDRIDRSRTYRSKLRPGTRCIYGSWYFSNQLEFSFCFRVDPKLRPFLAMNMVRTEATERLKDRTQKRRHSKVPQKLIRFYSGEAPTMNEMQDALEAKAVRWDFETEVHDLSPDEQLAFYQEKCDDALIEWQWHTLSSPCSQRIKKQKLS